MYVPISINPQTESGYKYVWESVLETSRFYGGLRETEKYYHAITLVTENLSGTSQYIEVDYRTSENSSWTNISTAFNTSPRQRQSLVSTNNTVGRWIQFRFRSYTDDEDVTPVIVSAILDSIERLDVNDTYSYTVRLDAGKSLDLKETQESDTGVEKLTQLETWVDSPKPLTLNTVSAFENNKTVFIEGMKKRPLYIRTDDVNKEVRIVDLTLIEVS